VIIAAILCIQMVWAAEPSGEAIDHRAAVDPTAYPWSAVGALFNGSHSECTAIAVAPDQALTAAHCLFGQPKGHPMQPQSLHLLLGFVHANDPVDAQAISSARDMIATGLTTHWARIGHS
jgi:hypothetical protein